MKLEPGDILEIVFEDGWCYAQVLLQHPVYHEVLSLDTTLYAGRVANIDGLSFSAVVMFPTASAVQCGQIALDRKLRGPPHQIPIFKIAVGNSSGEPVYWWIWNGAGMDLSSSDLDLSALPERRILALDTFKAQFFGSPV